ncbi:hypothetical protein NQ317_016009 [Molorchus minor]|uniref:Uncharacterized protein n=1 Tax=Molorchus minor TaxID=1323400 RepID=A0ABQ9JYK7_9CUCU|nr:hypothetical protein NQ317_016009 [Molorchus minor]
MRAEHSKTIRMINIAKPASLPPLVPHYSLTPSTSKEVPSKALPLIGKRKKIKMQLSEKPVPASSVSNVVDGEEEEEEEEIKETVNDNRSKKRH